LSISLQKDVPATTKSSRKISRVNGAKAFTPPVPIKASNSGVSLVIPVFHSSNSVMYSLYFSMLWLGLQLALQRLGQLSRTFAFKMGLAPLPGNPLEVLSDSFD